MYAVRCVLTVALCHGGKNTHSTRTILAPPAGCCSYVHAALKVAATVQHSEETKVLKDISHETGIGLAVTWKVLMKADHSRASKAKRLFEQ